jgi:glycosyltransferase involved in cell wall biosynthesis
MDNSLTIVVLTHNDELKIVDCLESLVFADELVIVDDESSDRTVELCKQFTSSIFIHPLNANFANQRNFALNHTKTKWVLFIDSDEIVSRALRDEIVRAIKEKECAGYYIKRIDRMWGKSLMHGEVGKVRLLRLGRRESGKWHGKVHETWRIIGKTLELSEPLIHIPHSTVFDFVRDVDDYSTLRADELLERAKKPSAIEIVTYPVAKFFQNYVLRKGYKDGVPGFIYAMLMSFHSFLVRAKLYLGKKK